jgi:sugar phosphate permease
MQNPTPPAPRLHYAWIVAATMFIAMLVAAGVRSAPGVLIVPLEQDLGWSRATVSFAVSVNLVLYGLLGPFAAALAVRFGARRMIVLSLTILAAGVALTTLMHRPWQLVLLWGVLVGAGSGMIAVATAATLINQWFTERRGLVMGLLMSSFAMGQLIFLPLMAYVTTQSGWRTMVLMIAAATAATIPVAFLWMRDRPADLGLRPYGETGAAPPPPAPPLHNPFVTAFKVLGRGVRSRDFWLLSSTFFICGLSTNGLIGTHLIPACIDAGISEVRAAGLLATIGALNMAGSTASGWLSDRWNNRYLLFWFYTLRGLSLMYLPFALDSVFFFGLTVFAVFNGLDWIATVPPTARLTADVFGKQDGAIMFGWVMAMHQVGAGVAAWGAGLLRVSYGNYEAAFLFAGATCLLAALLALLIARRGRAEISAAPQVAPQAGG